MNDQNRGTYNKAFQMWAKREAIRPIDFATKTGYSYIHAYNLLRGASDVTFETLGRIMLGYGTAVMNEIMGGDEDRDD